MLRFFARISTRSLITIFTLTCLVCNASFADALQERIKPDCLAPVARISSSLLQQIFSDLAIRISEPDFPEYLSSYPFSTNSLDEVKGVRLKDATEEELFASLTQALIERGIDIDFVGTILLKLSDGGNVKERTRYMMDAADEIAAFIHVFEQKQVDSDYINFMLEVLINSRNARQIILIVADVDTALSIATLLNKFEKNNISDEQIKPILETILRFDDVKERSAVLGAFFNSPELQSIGAVHKTRMSILTRISHLDDIKAVVEKIKAAVLNLDKDVKVRQQEKIYKAKKQGRFVRSIVAVCDGKGNPIGSAWVLEEKEGSYTLVTNNHVIEGMTEVLIKTHNRPPKYIGKAEVVLSFMQDRLGLRDIAVLEIKKDEVKGDSLIPINIAQGAVKEQMAALVSGYDMNDNAVSSGWVVPLGELCFLAGAISGPGNSGSPVLIPKPLDGDGYEAVAIHALAGPISILLTDKIRQELFSRKGKKLPDEMIIGEKLPGFLSLGTKANGFSLILVGQSI
ncbi:MAG: trypsin-like peptidase domain-containing protein [Candidatus Omnitrophota bacterium]